MCNFCCTFARFCGCAHLCAHETFGLGEESNFHMADVCALCLDDTGSNHCGAKF